MQKNFSPSSRSDEALVLAYHQGDNSARAELMVRYADWVDAGQTGEGSRQSFAAIGQPVGNGRINAGFADLWETQHVARHSSGSVSWHRRTSGQEQARVS